MASARAAKSWRAAARAAPAAGEFVRQVGKRGAVALRCARGEDES